ncbi:MAG: DALR domain-containing protein, partial [Bacilli bacterium]
KFLTALGDDLNISNALMELFEIVKKANQILREKELEIEKLKEVFQTIDDMLSILGINIEYVKLNKTDKKLYEDYIEAKKNKNFFHSDELRSQLIKKGII